MAECDDPGTPPRKETLETFSSWTQEFPVIPAVDHSDSAGDKPLVEDDCIIILRELDDVASEWYGIGMELGLRPGALDRISKGQDDIKDKFTKMILEWLKMSYDTKKHGLPTWRRIVEAVGAGYGGKNPALAAKIAKSHGVAVTQDSQPTTDPHTPFTDEINDETNNSICCCFGSKKSREQKKKKKSVNDEEPLIQEQPTKESVGFHRHSSTSSQASTIHINPAAHSVREKRTMSQSLPGNSTLPRAEQDPFGDPKSEFEESKDTSMAHPSWKIVQIAQLRSYWGPITGEQAEDILKKVRRNCYLIGYSKKKQQYIISVMVVDDFRMQMLAKHFPLNITQKGDHTVYDVEGAKKSFADVTELLNFYQKNPLTTEKCTTLGKPCNKPILGLM